MERVLTDANLGEELREKGLARAKQFTWERDSDYSPRPPMAQG